MNSDASRLPSAEYAAELLRGRRTVSLFLPELPPHELLRQAVEVARWAPNHRMTQPWRFYLLGEQSKQAIVDLNAELVAAQKTTAAGDAKRRRWQAIPGWLVVTCVRSDDPLQAREDYAACSCAVHNLMLYLWSHGVGCKWTTGEVIRNPRFYTLLDIDPQAEEVVSLLWYGYPAHSPKSKRKPVQNILSYRD